MHHINSETTKIQSNPTWSAYSNIYDTILCSTATYKNMINDLLGVSGPLIPISDGKVVFDLGCGTGNLSQQILANYQNVTLIAVDNDPAMSNVYKEKMISKLSDKPEQGKVFFMETNITNAMILLAKMNIKADYAFLVNVLFLVSHPFALLNKIANSMLTGGELRLSNPYDKTDLESLFGKLQSDLKEQKKYDILEKEFNLLKEFNKEQLSPMLRRFSQESLIKMIKRAGLNKINHVSDDHYGGQSLLISAIK